MVASGFTCGWVGKRHIILKQGSAASFDGMDRGNAPQPVRAEVMKQLHSFQAGYTKRDPQELDQFMKDLFPRDKNDRGLGYGT